MRLCSTLARDLEVLPNLRVWCMFAALALTNGAIILHHVFSSRMRRNKLSGVPFLVPRIGQGSDSPSLDAGRPDAMECRSHLQHAKPATALKLHHQGACDHCETCGGHQLG